MRILSVVLFLFLFFAPVVSAASPSAKLSPTRDRRYVYLTFTNLSAVSKVSYVVTYTSAGRERGFEGGFRLTSRTSRTTRKQILGTCSSKYCVFQKSPKNFHLDVTYTLRSGGTTTSSFTLP